MDQNLPKCIKITDWSKRNLGLFLVEIFEISKIKEKICGFGGGNKGKSVATLALIPYDVGGWPDLHGFEGKRG